MRQGSSEVCADNGTLPTEPLSALDSDGSRTCSASRTAAHSSSICKAHKLACVNAVWLFPENPCPCNLDSMFLKKTPKLCAATQKQQLRNAKKTDSYRCVAAQSQSQSSRLRSQLRDPRPPTPCLAQHCGGGHTPLPANYSSKLAESSTEALPMKRKKRKPILVS